MALKVLRVLPQELDMKRIAMKKFKDLSKMFTHELFSDLKAFEFELKRRDTEKISTSKTMTLVAEDSRKKTTESKEKMKEEYTLLLKKFKRS